MLSFLVAGIVLGVSAGFAPGPLLALVISETLRHGPVAGIKVALSPIVTDLPIVVATLFVLMKLSQFQNILGGVSVAGGCFVAYLGFQNFRITGFDLKLDGIRDKSLKKGVIANFLSPHPYFFWFGVGAPSTLRAMDHGLSAAIGFIAGFYVSLVTSKMAVAVLVGKSRSFLAGRAYIYVMRLMGMTLLVFGGLLIHEGFKLCLRM